MTELKVRTIKRYGNRKLYDTEGSRYVTLDEIARLIRAGEHVQIIDNQSKEDLTTVTLTQIILEEEKKKSRMPLDVLRKMIVDSGEQISEFFQERVVRPVQTFREEAGKKIGEKRPGEEGQEDIFRYMREWLSASQRSMEDFQKKLDDRLHNAIDGVANFKDLRGEFVELQKKARGLEERIEKIKNRLSDDANPPAPQPEPTPADEKKEGEES